MQDGREKCIDMLSLDHTYLENRGQKRIKAKVTGPRRFACQTVRYLHLHHGFSFDDLAYIAETSVESISQLFMFRERLDVDVTPIEKIYKKLGVSENLMQIYVEDWSNKFANIDNVPCCLYRVNEEYQLTDEAHWFSVGHLSTLFKSAKDILLFKCHDMRSSFLEFYKNDISLINIRERTFQDKSIYLIRGYEGLLSLAKATFMYIHGRPEMSKVFVNRDKSDTPLEADKLPENAIIGRVVWKGSAL